MKKRQKIYQVFFILSLLSILLLLLSPNVFLRSISGVVEKVFTPLQMSVYRNVGIKDEDNSKLKKLEEENVKMREELVKLKSLEEDVLSLRSQLRQTVYPARKLIPAQVIGINKEPLQKDSSYATEIVINIGKRQDIKKGMAVIINNVLIGTIDRVSNERSVVLLITGENISFPVRALHTNASGVIRNEKDQMIMQEVLLSEKLEISDTIVTQAGMREDGTGYPPDLLIGKITSVDKKPSALFQSARITPFIKMDDLSVVFVIYQ